MSVVIINNSTIANSVLKNRPDVDLIILDWLLNEEDSNEAEEILSELKENLFAPIIIYTNKGLDQPKRIIHEKNLDRLTVVLDKYTVDGDQVFNKLEEWFQINPELKIFLKWAWQIEKSMGISLWNIYDLEVNGLKAIIDILSDQGELSTTPIEREIIYLFQKVLNRNIDKNINLYNSIKVDLTKLKNKPMTSTVDDFEKLRRFHIFERYKEPIPSSIFTGDILVNRNNEYFIVVTPSCDLCHPEKIENILMIKAEMLEDYRFGRNLCLTGNIVKKDKQKIEDKAKSCLTNNSEVTHFLPYAGNSKYGLICRFDHIKSIKIKLLQKKLKNGEIKCVETIDSPFIENLIQRMNAYLSRIGIRGVGKKEINKIIADTNDPNIKEIMNILFD